MAGISGMALAVPDLCVDLEDWCHWFDDSISKIQDVVGSSYRMAGPAQNVYTLAASAVMKLIKQYELDPGRIGFLALGTESSLDNATGAVIVRGMVDQALAKLKLPKLSRHCEVPEYKHACLGGIYAIKNALRYLALDGRDKLAIVVSGDVAKYKLGSSGEPTQGAGAVAVLLEAKAKLMSFDLSLSGSSSRYRGLDFRKPFMRSPDRATSAAKPEYGVSDAPVFNGKYSVACYVDAVFSALEDMLSRRGIKRPAGYFRKLRSVFMHRPYQRLPRTAWALAYLRMLGHGRNNRRELEGYCKVAGVAVGQVLAELGQSVDYMEEMASEGFNGFDEPYPLSMRVLREFRKSDRYQQVVEEPMRLGDKQVRNLGNLYTASLPAWLASGFAQAFRENQDLSGQETLMVGYGSGDAAEVIPAKVEPTWREAASRINVEEAVAKPVHLTHAQYEQLHKTGKLSDCPPSTKGDFAVTRVGDGSNPALDDGGVEYYQYID